MKKDFNKINNIYKAVIILISICLNLYILFIFRNLELSIVLLIFCIFVITIFFIQEKRYEDYIKDSLLDLSQMLQTIIDMKDEEVFSTMEDTIFSKLQYQTIKLTNILNAKNKQMEKERNEIKSLVSDIAHQLKTPLTNLKMYGEFFKDESLSDEERNEFSEIMNLSLDRLTFLIESMIKMSRLEGGVINLRSEINDLNETIIHAIRQVQKKAMEKNIDIELFQKDKVKILHDKNWISEAIFNILENGVKYTPSKGKIKVSIENYEMFVRIDIEDNGMGIKEEEIPKIFMRFYRGNNVGNTEGIGIGLYLTRCIIAKHGGYIQVISSERGSKFSVFLPNIYE